MATPRRTTPGAALFGLILVAEATTFLVFAAAHHGHPLALGALRIEEPHIPLATVVEGLCGLVLLWAGYSLLAGSWRCWRAAVSAQLVALTGALAGFGALALRLAPRTPINDAYLRGMLVLLAAGLALSLAQLWRARARRRSAAFLRWRGATG
ncbi:hypothetical protein [Anaeromyxobacter sp. SG17]|uniref:hypothetical protein n=1 Tax=Anaeromyxobacter sp. SG17 TaxID=2925405 RepID=UPI001F590235|nr:hypothetical protein [Anaeromyxobacter sp. SG17]